MSNTQYNIKYSSMEVFYSEINQRIQEWNKQLQDWNTSCESLINMNSFNGQSATKVKAYLNEVHGFLLQSIGAAFSRLMAEFLTYKKGYYDIEANIYANISSDTIKSIETRLANEIKYLNNIKTDIDKSLNTISDIYWRGRPSNTVVHSSLSSEKNALTSFNSKIENYERKNYVAANGELKALLEALKRTIAMYSSSTRSVVSYNSGDIYNEPLALDLNKKVQASAEYIQKNQKEIEQAYAKQQEVMAQMQKDYEEACKAREDEGWAKLIAGGALAVTAIGLMVFSGGMATPLVVAGVCTAAYGISNSVEGVHDVRRGKIGDLDGVALNPIRDTIFMGNQTAYDVWGQVSSIVFFVGRPVASSVSSVAGSSLGVMGKTAAKSLAINLAIGGGSSFASNVATNHIAEKFNLNKTETTLLNIGMHIGLVYGARGVAKILKGKLFGKQDSVNIEDNGGHEAKIPRTGSEWNEYFKSKYGSENVEWHSKLTEGGSDATKGTSKINLNQKPNVTNEKLKNIINDLYKGQGGPNTIGNGTTMDAVRNEIKTGLPTNGKFHTQKLNDYLNALQRRLRAGDLNDYDKSVVNALIEDITNALNGK